MLIWHLIVLNTSFGWKYEVESKKYRKTIHQYFSENNWRYETSITQIKIFKKRDKVTVMIETHRVGPLIGKGCTFIDGLEQYLKEQLQEDIKIDLHECKMWHKLYS